jgi:hypothetical protein
MSACNKRPRDSALDDDDDDGECCWICLAGAGPSSGPLESFCGCPPAARVAHRQCLRTFTIYKAGTELR